MTATITITILLGLLWLLATDSRAATKPSPRASVAQQLNRGLAHTPMRHTGFALERAGYRWHIHPAFIAAIAGTESSFGAEACRSNRYNAFGLASCGSSWNVPRFRSWKHAYMFMGKFLSTRWRGAQSPYDFHGYAACSACWGRKTSYWMQRLGFPAQVRYP